MTTLPGTLTILTGTFSSCSKLSFSVVSIQKMPATSRKNRKIRNSLLAQPNRKRLILLRMSAISLSASMSYFCMGTLAMFWKTAPLATVMTTSLAIFTSTVPLAMSTLFTVP